MKQLSELSQLQAKAEEVYMKITSYANYSQINCITREWFIEKIKEGLTEILTNCENKFLETLIEELPSHGIDTSKWEYNYGDCCDSAIEFIARAFKDAQVNSEELENQTKLIQSEYLNDKLNNEIERLKELLNKQVTAGCSCEACATQWQQFKIENNL